MIPCKHCGHRKSQHPGIPIKVHLGSTNGKPLTHIHTPGCGARLKRRPTDDYYIDYCRCPGFEPEPFVELLVENFL